VSSRPIRSDLALTLFNIPDNIPLDASYGEIAAICDSLDPLAGLRSRVIVIRDPYQPSYGTLAGAGQVAKLSNRLTEVDYLFSDLLKIQLEDDGSIYRDGGDVGSLIVTADGSAVGVLLGRNANVLFAAPLQPFLKHHGLRFAGANDLASFSPAEVLQPETERIISLLRKEIERLIAGSLDVASIGAQVGVRIVNYSRTEAGHLELATVWPALSVPMASAKDQSAPADETYRFRVARIHAIRSWRNSQISDPHTSERERLRELDSYLGYNLGAWNRSRNILDQLESEFDKGRTAKWFDADTKYPDHLVIAYSGYHEEKILADIIDMLSTVHTSHTLAKAESPYAFGRKLYEPWRGLNEMQGGADIRLVNVCAGKPRKNEVLVADTPIFQHHGYRAYCHQDWLLQKLADDRIPAEVRSWIVEAAAGGIATLSPQSLPARAWLCLSGRPPNYRSTEFQMLLEHLAQAAGGLNGAPSVPEKTDDPPDEVFERFVLGNRTREVFIGGSIHDFLIDDWLANGDDIVPLITPEDFQDLRVETKGAFGANALLFSPRVARWPGLVRCIVTLYANVWDTLVLLLNDPVTKDRAVQYLRHVLRPKVADPHAWSFAATDDAIVRLITSEDRPVERAVVLPFLVNSKP
jgi:hypothetical protein